MCRTFRQAQSDKVWALGYGIIINAGSGYSLQAFARATPFGKRRAKGFPLLSRSLSATKHCSSAA
ncbi:hypothetical protein [Flavisolibacter ginsenosidimutans]|uniref:Uncharacterized protein n=1 Tax=Flavisolibacter ginsenosidimutans TaxID=661481 RepID=A0A5B8UHV8_9BACT|nr:hypothetical protein [Flavisolibacter ginsenosidimutans]QEC55936.1 hypothetical protein FSB75_08515 [Flavisolibacter ginsenosidimutans]